MMTADQIATIRSTWNLMGATTDAVAPQFYDRLFEYDASLRALFPAGDMSLQAEKLGQTLAVVVKSLDDLSRLLPAVQALGARHNGYGVTAAHYDVVGRALLDTFANVLGEHFTPAAREAWTTAYVTLATVMQEAARDSQH
ncbi:MAG: hemin receptor [Gemmatimonadaceae bacterium]|nr:hemin receptor [Gemmatimonadaceae bacterium]